MIENSNKMITTIKILLLLSLFTTLFSLTSMQVNASETKEDKILKNTYKIRQAEKTVEYGSTIDEMEALIQSQYPEGTILDIKALKTDDNQAIFMVTINFDYLASHNVEQVVPPVARFVFTFEDTMAPIIEAKDSITLTAGDTFSNDLLEIKAYDVVDGELDYQVTGSVDSNTVGEYTLHVSATDGHGLVTEKTCVVNVVEKPVVQSSNRGYASYTSPNYEVIDATTYKVRGKIVKLVNNPSPSVVSGWINQIQTIPAIFFDCVTYFEINGGNMMDACQAWDVPLVAACTWPDNRIILHGSMLTYNSVPLHESLHAFDNLHGVSNVIVNEGAYSAEMYNIPKQYGNRLNKAEFFVNAALLYLSNPASLQASCPQTYAIIARYF